MQHIRRIIGVTITVAVLGSGMGMGLAQDDPVLVTVNGQPIASSELQTQLLYRWGDIALGGLIQEMAIEQAAAEAGVSVSDREVEQRAENFQRNLDIQAAATGSNFTMWLARQKMTPYAFRKWVRNELLLEKMVGDEAAVTDDEVQQVWEASREQFRQPERMYVSHICVKTRDEAQSIRAEIIAGKSFEEAAAEYSIDPYTKESGGDLGPISSGDSPFQRVAFSLSADSELSEPVQSPQGFHIIRRDRHIPAGVPEFAEVEEQLRERIEQQKLANLMNQKRSEIMQNARIEHEMSPSELAD